MAGFPGIIICTIGTVIPPFAIIFIISMFYHAFISNQIISHLLVGMRAGVGALIVSVVYDMSRGVIKENAARSIIIMGLTFILNYFLDVNIALIVLGCIVIALFDTFVIRKEPKQ